MGCSSSREVDPSAGNARPSPAASHNPLASNHVATSQSPLSPNPNHVNSPSASRAALNPVSSTSLRSGSVVSSSRPSENRHRHRGTTDATSTLSEHYNLPLQPPKPWRSQSRAWTPSQLRRERQDFFDTRVTGQAEVWAALRRVSECIREGDIADAQGILDAVNVTLPTGHVEDGAYDERGFLYRVPEEALSDPTNLQPDEGEVDAKTVVELPADAQAKLSKDSLVQQSNSLPKVIQEKQEMNSAEKDKEAMPEDAIKLKCRLSDRGSDVSSYISRKESVGTLAARLKHLAQIPSYSRIEVFYLGKKLDQKKTIEEQDYMEGHVLNIFVVGAPK